MKVITYPLYGRSKLYVQGLIDNIPLAHKHYPDFKVRVYCAVNCPGLPVLRKMQSDYPLEIVEKPPTDTVWGSTVNAQEHGNHTHRFMVHRYEAIFDPEVDVWLTRDSDSRISEREVDSVREWLETGLGGHAIYERECHHTNGNAAMPFGIGVLTKFFKGNTLEQWHQTENQFWNWYITQGYHMSLRAVHFDIHLYREFFFAPLKKMGQMYQCGFGTPNPLKVPVGEYGEVGSTVNEEWRYIPYD